MALAELDAARTSVVAEAVRAYLELRSAQAEGANLAARLDAQTDRVTLTQTRERLRLADLREVGAEQTRLQELRSQRLAAEQRAAESAERLGLLLASADAETCTDCAETAVPVLTDYRLSELPADLLRTRPDVHRAEMTVLKVTADLKLAQAAMYPRLMLGGSLQLAIPVSGASSRSLLSAGPTIDVPLFDWGMRRANRDAQSALLDASLSAYRESILEGVHETETALAALESMRLDVTACRARAEISARAERSALEAARFHLGSQIEVLAARLERLEADSALLAAERAHGLAFVALFKALGGASLATSQS